jgi:hypothetical protein
VDDINSAHRLESSARLAFGCCSVNEGGTDDC